MRKYQFAKYSFLELMFARWQWVRKRSKAYWVLANYPYSMWVKFEKDELEFYGIDFSKYPEYTVEDWSL